MRVRLNVAAVLTPLENKVNEGKEISEDRRTQGKQRPRWRSVRPLGYLHTCQSLAVTEAKRIMYLEGKATGSQWWARRACCQRRDLHYNQKLAKGIKGFTLAIHPADASCDVDLFLQRELRDSI